MLIMQKYIMLLMFQTFDFLLGKLHVGIPVESLK
jgi:hypothetical protein